MRTTITRPAPSGTVFVNARRLCLRRRETLLLFGGAVLVAVTMHAGFPLRADLTTSPEKMLVDALSTSLAVERRTNALLQKLDSDRAALRSLTATLQSIGRDKRQARIGLAQTLSQHEELQREMAKALEPQPRRFSLRSAIASIVVWFRGKIGSSEGNHQMTTVSEAVDTLHAAANAAADEADTLRNTHEELLQQYDAALHDVDAAKQSIAREESALRGNWATTARIEHSLLRIQTELVSAPRVVEAGTGTRLPAAKPKNSRARFLEQYSSNREYSWPVNGKRGAGFMDSEYKKFFGFPHVGVDLLVNEGTSIRAAAEGVVFAVRDGGKEGYTSVLVGHRGGVATVYGHLSTVSVHAGDWLSQSQEVGKSGGRPGTDGAGESTTGPHLHFEMIFLGKHLDPLKILSRK